MIKNNKYKLCFFYKELLYHEYDVLLIGGKEACRGKGLIKFGIHEGEVLPCVVLEWLLSDEQGNFAPLDYYFNPTFENCVEKIGNAIDSPDLWPFTKKLNYGEENEKRNG